MKTSIILIISASYLFLQTAACDSKEAATPGKHDEHGEHGSHDEDDDHDGHDEGEGGESVVHMTPEAIKAADIATAKVVYKDIPHVLELTGELAFPPNAVTHVSPRLPGHILKTEVRVGDRVTEGQVIATVRSAALGERVASFLASREKRKTLKTNVSRLDRLRKKNLIPESELVAARTALSEAKGELLSGRERLLVIGLSADAIDGLRFGTDDASTLTVVSPKAGRVIELHASVGEHVRPESPIAVVADDLVLELWVNVSSRDMSHIHEGNTAHVTTPAYPQQSFSGTVDYVGDKVDSSSRLLQARVVIPNTDRRLRPGNYVTVEVVEEEPRGHGEGNGHAHNGHEVHTLKQMTVPASAVRRNEEGKDVVWVVVGEGRYERRVVNVAFRRGGLAGLSKGVKDGESVVVKGVFMLSSTSRRGSLALDHDH